MYPILQVLVLSEVFSGSRIDPNCDLLCIGRLAPLIVGGGIEEGSYISGVADDSIH
jgi:hypothetical protein